MKAIANYIGSICPICGNSINSNIILDDEAACLLMCSRIFIENNKYCIQIMMVVNKNIFFFSQNIEDNITKMLLLTSQEEGFMKEYMLGKLSLLNITKERLAKIANTYLLLQ